MLIAVLSDSHDQVANLHLAVLRANQARADLLIHCGDLISPFMLTHLHAFNGPVHLVYGNNVGDQHQIAEACDKSFHNLHHHGPYAFLNIDKWRIGVIHYPEVARKLARTGDFDLVCYGHNHIYKVEQVGSCMLVNPGDLLGDETQPSFVLINLEEHSVHREFTGQMMVLQDK